jgi:hypothetical protein
VIVAVALLWTGIPHVDTDYYRQYLTVGYVFGPALASVSEFVPAYLIAESAVDPSITGPGRLAVGGLLVFLGFVVTSYYALAGM